jgi:hypothetical protein
MNPLPIILGILYFLNPAKPLVAGGAKIAADLATPGTPIEAPLGSESRPLGSLPSAPSGPDIPPIDAGPDGPAAAVDLPTPMRTSVSPRIE